MLHECSCTFCQGCYLCFTVSFFSIFVVAGIFSIYLGSTCTSNGSCTCNGSRCKNNEWNMFQIGGGIFIVAGLAAIILTICLFRCETKKYVTKEKPRYDLGSALVNTGLSMSRVSEPRSEGTDKRLAAEPPIVILPNPGRVFVPSAPTYDHWMKNNNETDSPSGYDEIGCRISRSSLPNYEEAIAMSYVSTTLHI